MGPISGVGLSIAGCLCVTCSMLSIRKMKKTEPFAIVVWFSFFSVLFGIGHALVIQYGFGVDVSCHSYVNVV